MVAINKDHLLAAVHDFEKGKETKEISTIVVLCP